MGGGICSSGGDPFKQLERARAGFQSVRSFEEPKQLHSSLSVTPVLFVTTHKHTCADLAFPSLLPDMPPPCPSTVFPPGGV